MANISILIKNSKSVITAEVSEERREKKSPNLPITLSPYPLINLISLSGLGGISFFEGLLDQAFSGLVSPFSGGPHFQDILQAVLLFQAFIDF